MGVSHNCSLTTDSKVAKQDMGDLYTRNIPLTQKARFWGNYVSALKGNADLCAASEARVINFYPSITETIPPTYPGLRQEFGKLETLMWYSTREDLPPLPSCPRLMTGYTLLDGTTAQSTPRSMDPTGTRLSEASNQPLP